MSRIVFTCLFAVTVAGAPAAQLVSGRNQHDALQHYRAGEDALHGERLDVAEREFHDAVKLDPLLHLAHYGLGQVYMLTKRYPLAVRAYLDAREAFQRDAAQALQNNVLYERQVDDQIRALDDLRRTLDPNERNGPGRPKLADPNATLQHVDGQINQLKSQRRRSPDKPLETPAWISLALGSGYFRTDKMADAEREYREAVRVEPKLGEAHNNLAIVCMLTDRLDAAEEEVKVAEKNGFRVNAQFKGDLKNRRKNVSRQ